MARAIVLVDPVRFTDHVIRTHNLNHANSPARQSCKACRTYGTDALTTDPSKARPS